MMKPKKQVAARALVRTAAATPGKRLSVRQRLIDAAYAMFGRIGFEASTIAEIIEEAGVGVGSFYNHFSSKEDMAQAVFSAHVEAYGADMERIVRRSPNVAAVTCYAYRRVIEKAEKDKVWAAFIVQLEPAMQMLDRLQRPHARIGLGIGVAAGVLTVGNIEAGITAINGMEVAMVRAMLAGEISHKEAHKSVIFPLRMFGVAEAEAARLSNLSMAALRREIQAS